jgi:hypothetical protein
VSSHPGLYCLQSFISCSRIITFVYFLLLFHFAYFRFFLINNVYLCISISVIWDFPYIVSMFLFRKPVFKSLKSV